MNKNKIKNEHFEILRKIQKEPSRSQRAMATDLGFSLGKFNYCLKALQAKGLVKINNFKKIQKIKLSLYFNPKGIAAKTELTIMFMKEK